CRDLAHGVVDWRPIGQPTEDLLSDQDSGRGAVAYAPCVEPCGDVETRRLRQCAGKWNAVGGIVVLVDPPPGNVADFEISLGPGFEIAEMRGHVSVVPGGEFGAQNDQQWTVLVDSRPQRMCRLIDADEHTVDRRL